MRRLVMLSAVLIGFGLPQGPASALPAPMSQEQLLEKSDLVALVRIKSVTCVSVGKDDRTGEELPSYSARAELIEVIKGEDVKGDTVNIAFPRSRPACSAPGPSITIRAKWSGRISSARTANTPPPGGTPAATW